MHMTIHFGHDEKKLSKLPDPQHQGAGSFQISHIGTIKMVPYGKMN